LKFAEEYKNFEENLNTKLWISEELANVTLKISDPEIISKFQQLPFVRQKRYSFIVDNKQ
jgi:hypothetical protein